MDNLSMSNPIFATYVFYAALLVLKMYAMVFFTAKQRFTKKAFSAPEDYAGHGLRPKPIGFQDEDVERVRRAHLNDLENIPAFLIIGFLFVLTNPSILIAKWIFRIFTIARFLHTFGYLNGIHSLRGMGFIPSFLCNLAMTSMVLYSACGSF